MSEADACEKGWVNESEIELVAMAGSKGGKHSKNKRKSKSNKSDGINQDSRQISNNNPVEPKDSKDKNAHPDMNSTMTTSRPNYTEKELEQFLLVKLEGSYIKAKGWLLESGYGLAEIDRAILNAGYINSLMDLQSNLLTNLLYFIEGKFVPKRPAFKDLDQLYNTMLETLVFGIMQAQPNMQRSNSMWLLLMTNWGSPPAVAVTSQGSSSCSKNENDEKIPYESNIGILKSVSLKPALVSRLRQNVPILAAALQRKIGASVIQQKAIPNTDGFFTSEEGSFYIAFLRACLESDSVTPELVHLVKNISELYEEVKKNKEWAQKTVMGSATSVSKHLLEIKALRMDTLTTEK